MCWQNVSFLSNMKPQYCKIVFRDNTGPLIKERSREGELKIPWDLEKWKTSVFPCSITSSN